MEKFTLITVTASNIFGIIPCISLFNTKRYGGTVLVASACLASVFMHLTETKHGLKGLFLKEYSNMFLNIDRVLAIMTGLYGLWLFYNNPRKNIYQLAFPLIGAISSFVGEQTTNLPLYTFTHCIWHALAYYSLHLVNYLKKSIILIYF